MKPKSAIAAVIDTFPAPRIETTPLSSTTATLVLELVQITSLFVALSGNTVAFNTIWSPTSQVRFSSFKDIDSTGV